jgi:hypothetical protein
VDPEEVQRVVLVVDVDSVARPDLAVVDALARLQLAARRLGGTIRIHHVSHELRGLLVLAGLSGVLPVCAGLGGEGGRKAEEREERAVEVDEEGDVGDPPV